MAYDTGQPSDTDAQQKKRTSREKILGFATAILGFAAAVLTLVTVVVSGDKSDAESIAAQRGDDVSVLEQENSRLSSRVAELEAQNARPDPQPSDSGTSATPGGYTVAINARQVVLPASDFTEQYGADLDKPQVGTSISGEDVIVPSDVHRVFQGDPVSDTHIAPAPPSSIEPEECEALAREQPVEEVELDDLKPAASAFCLITDEAAVAYLKFSGRRAGEDLVFELTLWKPN